MLKQDRSNVLAQTGNLVGIVPEEIMPPGVVRFFAAVLEERAADGFVIAEPCSLERLRFSKGAEDEDSIDQALRNSALSVLRPPFIAVEVDQQNHVSFGITIHCCHMF